MRFTHKLVGILFIYFLFEIILFKLYWKVTLLFNSRNKTVSILRVHTTGKNNSNVGRFRRHYRVPFKALVSNPRPIRLCYAARGHFCKLYIYIINGTMMQDVRYLSWFLHVRPAVQPTITLMTLFSKTFWALMSLRMLNFGNASGFI